LRKKKDVQTVRKRCPHEWGRKLLGIKLGIKKGQRKWRRGVFKEGVGGDTKGNMRGSDSRSEVLRNVMGGRKEKAWGIEMRGSQKEEPSAVFPRVGKDSTSRK